MISTDDRVRSIPPTYRSELREAAFNHGYRRDNGEADGWLYFASDIDVPGEVALAVSADGDAWFLAVEHAGVAAELAAPPACPPPGTLRAAFAFANQAVLRQALHRAYQLSASLPSLPLHEFEREVAGLGDTEVERLRRERIGQDIFRSALLRYWNGRCPLTGVTEPALLRASHIVPWAQCASDAERLDVHNGLLLAAHWDAAFDAGLVSFSDGGAPLLSPDSSAAALTLFATSLTLPLKAEHQVQMSWHRKKYGFAPAI